MRAAIITGAAGGIGSALCAEFRTAGYLVIAVDRAPLHGRWDANVQCDIADVCLPGASREDALSRLRDAIRGHDLSALVNNAAVQHLGGAEDITPAAWEETFRTNVQAPFALTQALLPALEAAEGSVINIGSIHAQATKPGFVAYAASKAALTGLTRSLAVDLGGRVRVNAIVPAAIETPMLRAGFAGRERSLAELHRMHPSGTIGMPADVARIAVFLASSDAPFVNGAIWNIDGGISGRLHDPE
jgi:NAD(P)-dependent dehydrogenase (short-subunit alcohol dehydrogenase family)